MEQSNPPHRTYQLSHKDHLVLLQPAKYIGSFEKVRSDTRILYDNRIQEVNNIEIAEAEFNIFCDMFVILMKYQNNNNIIITLNGNQVTIQFESYLSLTSDIDPKRTDFGLMFDLEYFDPRFRNRMHALTNLFSERFTVNMFDYQKRIHCIQEWSNNGTVISSPVIELNHSKTEGPSTGSKLIISYRLGSSNMSQCDINKRKLELYLLEQAMTSKLNITTHIKYTSGWDHRVFGPISIQSYSDYYFNPDLEKIYYRSSDLFEDTNKPRLEFCIIQTPTDGQVSFINGNFTRDGGSHVYLVRDRLNQVLSDNDLSHHIPNLTYTIFVSCWIPSPFYDSPSKANLISMLYNGYSPNYYNSDEKEHTFYIPPLVFTPILQW